MTQILLNKVNCLVITVLTVALQLAKLIVIIIVRVYKTLRYLQTHKHTRTHKHVKHSFM